MPLGAKPLVTLIVLESLTQLIHLLYKKCAKSLRVFCFLYSLRALLLDVDVQKNLRASRMDLTIKECFFDI